MTGDLDILWEDPHGLAVNKPAGLLVHPGTSPNVGPTLEQAVRRHLRPDDPGSVYLGTVHRLDRPVSGVILWAKTPRAAQRWAEQFRTRAVRKEYWAIVERTDPNLPCIEPGACWEDWISAPDRLGQARLVSEAAPGTLHAITRVEPGRRDLSRSGEPVEFLVLRPETGRTHQLRAQAAGRGQPIVGDQTYGSSLAFDSGIALHARRLTVEHPTRREPMTLEASTPVAWSRWGI